MSSVTSNKFESLSNELLLEICEYLDAYDLYQSFYGLNHRINTILQLARLHILYNSSNKDETIWNKLSSVFHPSQIRVLSSHNDSNVTEPYRSAVKQNLYSVRLYNLHETSIENLFQSFPVNNQIKCLYVKPKEGYYSEHEVTAALVLIKHGHRFDSLVNLSITDIGGIHDFPDVSVIFPNLRHLSICNYYWSPDFLRFLQSNTPNLRSLKFNGYFSMYQFSSDLIVKQLQELHIVFRNSIHDLQLICPAFPSLRRLHIQDETNRRSQYVNGASWQKLIENHLPLLKHFTIDYGEGIDEEILKTFYAGEFWLTKKVKVKMIVNKISSRYRLVKTIYFGKQWEFKYLENFY